MSRAALCLLLAACGSKGSEPAPAQQPPPAPADAGVDGITAIGTYDPSSGRHLDDDVPRPPRKPPPKRDAKPIDILLKSSPSNAYASVDGEGIGYTPTMWTGYADGQPHDFTFVKDGHSVAKYRFIPITGGVVHAKLVVIAQDGVDAGVQDAGSSSTSFAPDAAVPAAPPIDAATFPIRRPDASEAPAPPADAAPAQGSAAPLTPSGGGAGPPP